MKYNYQVIIRSQNPDHKDKSFNVAGIVEADTFDNAATEAQKFFQEAFGIQADVINLYRQDP